MEKTKKRQVDYFYKVGEIVKTKHGLLKIISQIRKTTKKGNVKAYRYLCLECNNNDIIMESNLKIGKGCNTCCPNPNVVKENINSIYAVNKDFANLFENIEESKKFTISSGKIARLKCPNCGFVDDYKISTVNRHGFNCKRCSDGLSIGERFVNELLLVSEIKYYFHYSKFDWCKDINHPNSKLSGNKEYDFYIPSLNMIIEVHGMQHYENKFETISQKARTLEEEQENDRIKETIARNNGIDKYIILDCRYSDFDFIFSSLLNSSILDILNIKVDNYKLREMYKNSLKSNIVKVCELYNIYNDVSMVAKITHNKLDTIRKWLNKGNKIGLCNYNGKFNSNNANSKAILNTITGNKYKSISEASRILNINRNKLSDMVKDDGNKEWVKI